MKRSIIFLLLVSTVLVLYLASCDKVKKSYSTKKAKKESELVVKNGSIEDVIDNLNTKDKEIDKAIGKIVNKVNNQKKLYSQLGDSYLILKWYKKAYLSYRKAIGINPGIEVLHYKAAVSAANFHKSIAPLTDTFVNNSAAVAHYKKAIELRADYKEALMGLALLYHFEMGMSLDALELVNKGLLIVSSESEEKVKKAGIPTPQLLMLRGNIYRFLSDYKMKTGQSYPNSTELKSRLDGYRESTGKSPGEWKDFAIDDYSSVIENFGNLDQPDILDQVKSAIRLKSKLSGTNN